LLSINRFITLSAISHLSYYEILGVKTDCSEKEIREAFVRKSKLNHPDLQKNVAAKSSKEFIKVMEAYKVLSKAHSRANYDLHLQGIDRMNYVSKSSYHEPWKAETLRKATSPDYYGVKGLKKMSNWKIVMACVIFCAVGSVIQAVAIRKSFTFKRQEMIDRSAVASENLAKARDNANKFSVEEQLERLAQNKQRGPSS
jgi:DnaJ homolog subfamily C member 4